MGGTLTGAQIDRLDDKQLASALPQTTIFARATPEQKSRIIKAQRALGSTVGFLATASTMPALLREHVSAGGASLILSFLPMLPTQILLNNLLYDASEMTIPTDNVDEEQLQRPTHWDTRFIRRSASS